MFNNKRALLAGGSKYDSMSKQRAAEDYIAATKESLAKQKGFQK